MNPRQLSKPTKAAHTWGLLFLACGLLAGCSDSDDDASTGADGPDDHTDVACNLETESLPRRLRLLTRREYNATIADLFAGSNAPPGPAPQACSADVDCGIETASCIGGTCQADPCNLYTFILPGNSVPNAGSIVVAGSFNDWSATPPSAWALDYVPSIDSWVTKRVIDNGSYSYKFVVDGTDWMTDPNNPSSEPDGFGGQNSLLALNCTDADGAPSDPPDDGAAPNGLDLTADWAADFPVESRPEHFPFDNAAEAGLVTSVHVELYHRAADEIAAEATANPTALLGCSVDDNDCVRNFLTGFGRRALRRPFDPSEADRYLAFAPADAAAADRLRVALRIMLSSPYFLYRFEVGEAQPDGSYRLTADEIATALSYSLWGTMPDAALFKAADSGNLLTAEGIEAEARRLLADPRARPVVSVFAEQWLGIESLPTTDKAASVYPSFNTELASDMAAETRALVVRTAFDGTFGELFTTATTEVSPALASLYGVEAGTDGSASLPAERAAGLLGHASILSTYAHSDQTSPVRRGLFIRDRLLCQTIPAPPPDAGGVPEVDPSLSTRDRFEQHSSDPSCAGCHQYLDPLGFGFEHFDAIGQWRDEDAGYPVDASGEVIGLEGFGDESYTFSTLSELGSLIAQSEAAPSCFAQQAHRFAMGSALIDGDDLACTHDALVTRFAESGYDIRELLIGVALTPSFVRRH